MKYGCLSSAIGGMIGLLIGARMEAAEIRAIRAVEPDATIDFLFPVFPFLGMILGCFLGALVGMILGRSLASKS